MLQDPDLPRLVSTRLAWVTVFRPISPFQKTAHPAGTAGQARSGNRHLTSKWYLSTSSSTYRGFYQSQRNPTIMIEMNGTPYSLCLLDTNALSEMAKHPERELRNFLEWSLRSSPKVIACFTPFSIIEIRRRPSVYRKFLDSFSRFPCAMLKGHEELLHEEVLAYSSNALISPMSLAFSAIPSSGHKSLSETLDHCFSLPQILEKEKGWNSGRDAALAGILSLVNNYPPSSGGRYSPKDIRSFLEITVFEQLAMRHHAFATSVVDKNDAIDINRFPSLKMQLFTVFFRFYIDKRRKPEKSDVFDILNASQTPYVDSIVTERHHAEVLKQIQGRDGFIDSVRKFVIQDFR